MLSNGVTNIRTTVKNNELRKLKRDQWGRSA